MEHGLYEKNRIDTWMILFSLVYAGGASLVGCELGREYYLPYLYIGIPILGAFFLWRFIDNMRKGSVCWVYLLFFNGPNALVGILPVTLHPAGGCDHGEDLSSQLT